MADSVHKITGNLATGIDFFGINVKQCSSSISIDSTVNVLTKRVRLVEVSIEISSTLLISSSEFQYERVDIHNYAGVTVSAKKTSFSSSSVSGSVSASFLTSKIVHASASMTSSLSISIAPKEILKARTSIALSSGISVSTLRTRIASSQINSSLSTSFSAHEVLNASSSISIFQTTIAVFQEINLIAISISPLSPKLIINSIIFKTNDVVDTAQYKTLFVLDGSPLTNQGRTLSSDLSQVINENKNWNNSKSRYYKRSGSSGRRTFNIAWSYLPSARHDTIDKRHARDFLKKIANDPDIHTLKVLNDDSSNTTAYTETEYNVFIRDYSETLLRRDLINDVYYWDCNMTLEEA